MKLDDVTSIMQIWKVAKSEGEKFNKDGPMYEYRVESGELVAFIWELSEIIENSPKLGAYYATNFHLYVDYIKKANAKEQGHGFIFTYPHI